jgi:hypothetical protein
MAQLYFLSIILNLVAGFVLVMREKKNGMESTGVDDPEMDPETSGRTGTTKKEFSFQDLAVNKGFHFFIGTVTFIIGVFKLLASYDGIVIVGDLLPAAAGVVLGGMLFVDYFKSTTTVQSEIIDRLEQVFLRNKKYFGAAGIAVAIVHFIFPQIVLL